MDYSFIRFEDNFDKAKKIKISPMSSLLYNSNEVVQLLPNEFYLQISNNDNGISFAGDYKCFVVDCEGKELSEITQNTSIFEFTDRNGINQIAIEFYKLNVDFGKRPVYFKLVHTTGTDVYYSNALCITDYNSHLTTRIDYKHHTYFNGISYDKVPYYQSIRLVTWYANLLDETEISDYYQITNGNSISARPLRKQKETYKCELMNDFAFERSNIMMLHDIIYFDGVRVTNKTTFKSGEFIGNTNIYRSEISVYKDYNQNYIAYPFIYEPLNVVTKLPIGIRTLLTLENKISLLFNKEITLNSGTIKVYDGETLLFTYNSGVDIFTSLNYAETIPNIDTYIGSNGTYKIVVSKGLFSFLTEENEELIWEFTIKSGDYSNSDYNSVDYLTN